ncbi:MAG: hypothetical protein U0Z44_09000 [Kouleothrix sp.]
MRNRDKLLRQLIDLQFERNDIDFHRGTFRVRGDTLDIFPANAEIAGAGVEFWGDEIEKITEFDPLTGEVLVARTAVDIFPAKHFIANTEKLQLAISDIERADRARGCARGREQAARGCPAQAAHHVMILRCWARWATARASRTIHGIWIGACLARRRPGP